MSSRYSKCSKLEQVLEQYCHAICQKTGYRCSYLAKKNSYWCGHHCKSWAKECVSVWGDEKYDIYWFSPETQKKILKKVTPKRECDAITIANCKKCNNKQKKNGFCFQHTNWAFSDKPVNTEISKKNQKIVSMYPYDQWTICKATTKKGLRCLNNIKYTKEYCGKHTHRIFM